MIVGFLGDVHGQVLNALGVLDRWQREKGVQFDLIIQVGDLGAWPDPARADQATQRFAQTDPGEFDFSRLFHLSDQEKKALAHLRQRFKTPVLFIRGNHEDAVWLDRLATERTPPILVDPVGLYQYIPDGTVLQVRDCTIGFAGGGDISDSAYSAKQPLSNHQPRQSRHPGYTQGRISLCTRQLARRVHQARKHSPSRLAILIGHVCRKVRPVRLRAALPNRRQP